MKLLVFLLFLPMAKPQSASIPSLETRIIRGYNCSVHEYSYLASISYGRKIGLQFCGASLITTRWILSAAHCCDIIKKMDFSKFKVYFGKSIWLKDPEQTAGISTLIMHERFNLRSYLNDICLLKLTRDVKPSNKVKISKLVTTDELGRMMKNKMCDKSLVIGFGRQTYEPRAMPSHADQGYIDHVQCTKLKLLDQSSCKILLKNLMPETAICARDPHPNKGVPLTDACGGDSGGPLFCNGVQIGIVSAGIGCGTTHGGVYSRVDIYDDFIRSAIPEFRGAEATDKTPETTDSKASGLTLLPLCALCIFIYVIRVICG